jgi:hypothetical protein
VIVAVLGCTYASSTCYSVSKGQNLVLKKSIDILWNLELSHLSCGNNIREFRLDQTGMGGQQYCRTCGREFVGVSLPFPHVNTVLLVPYRMG